MLRSRLLSCLVMVLLCCAFLMNYGNAGTLPSNSETESHIEPTTEDHVEPETKDHVESEIEDHVEPETKGHVEPETKDNVEPETEDHIEPVTKAHVEPETEDDEEPETEDDEELETEDDEELESEDDVESETKAPVEPPDVTNHKNLNLLPKECGYLDTASKIVGGENAGLTEFPWMALLQFKTALVPLVNGCGGSIINKNYILTAAHCVVELDPGEKLIGVRVGEYNISNETDCEIQETNTTKCNPPVQDLKIEEIIPYPESLAEETGFFPDIALVRVSTMNLEVENVRPICLPIGSARDAHFNTAWVSGWGVEDVKTQTQSNVLLKASIPVPNEGNCSKYPDYIGKNVLTQLCADIKNGTDTCQGDSGGPLVVATLLDGDRVALVQQGIVSYGIAACGGEPPGVYTRVKYFMDWILDNLKE